MIQYLCIPFEITQLSTTFEPSVMSLQNVVIFFEINDRDITMMTSSFQNQFFKLHPAHAKLGVSMTFGLEVR